MADKDLYALVNRKNSILRNFIEFLSIQSKIFYYFRERYYSQAYKSAKDSLKRYGNDALLKFYSALAQLMDGKIKNIGISSDKFLSL